jgi:hypothetical protein
MSTLLIGKKSFYVPGNWEQLEASQTLALIPLLQARKPANEIKVRALLILLKVKERFSLQWLLKKVSEEQLMDMLPLTDFLWEKRSFTQQKFKKVAALHGPDDNFANLVFIEFIKGEQYYLAFSQSSDIAQLNKLLAVLWRPLDSSGNRERFADETLLERAAAIASWSLEQKLAMYLWYDSCRQLLVNSFPLVFSRSDSATFHPSKRAKGWIDVAATLAENITNMEEVFFSDLHLVLLFLSNKIEEMNETKKTT